MSEHNPTQAASEKTQSSKKIARIEVTGDHDDSGLLNGVNNLCLRRKSAGEFETLSGESSTPISPLNDSRKVPFYRSQVSGESAKSAKSSKSTRSSFSKPILPTSPMPSWTSAMPRNIADWNERVTNGFEAQVTRPSDPPRPPKEGFEWVWFPEGYWAEREMRNAPPKAPSTLYKWWERNPDRKSKASGEFTDKSSPDFEIPEIRIESRRSRGSWRSRSPPKNQAGSRRPSSKTSTSKSILGFTFIEHQVSEPRRPSEKLGLYCRAKKNIEALVQKPPFVSMTPKFKTVLNSFETVDSSSTDSTKESLSSRTATLLKGTSSYFDRLNREKSDRQRRYLATASPQSSSSPSSRRSRRRFGLAPWHHRRNSNDSQYTISSSVHKLLRGETPMATPKSEGRYMGSTGASFPQGK